MAGFQVPSNFGGVDYDWLNPLAGMGWETGFQVLRDALIERRSFVSDSTFIPTTWNNWTTQYRLSCRSYKNPEVVWDGQVIPITSRNDLQQYMLWDQSTESVNQFWDKMEALTLEDLSFFRNGGNLPYGTYVNSDICQQGYKLIRAMSECFGSPINNSSANVINEIDTNNYADYASGYPTYTQTADTGKLDPRISYNTFPLSSEYSYFRVSSAHKQFTRMFIEAFYYSPQVKEMPNGAYKVTYHYHDDLSIINGNFPFYENAMTQDLMHSIESTSTGGGAHLIPLVDLPIDPAIPPNESLLATFTNESSYYFVEINNPETVEFYAP